MNTERDSDDQEESESLHQQLSELIHAPISAFYEFAAARKDVPASRATAIVATALISNLGFLFATRAAVSHRGAEQIDRDIEKLLKNVKEMAHKALAKIEENKNEIKAEADRLREAAKDKVEDDDLADDRVLN